MTAQFAYRAFGLNIVADLALPELPPAIAPHSSIDLRIELIDHATANMSSNPEAIFQLGLEGGYLLRIADVADFHVSHGDLIRMTLLPSADPGMARLYLLGSAMGMAMHQRGWLV